MLLRSPRVRAATRGPRQVAPAVRSIMATVTSSGYPRAMPGVVTQFRWFMTACACGLYTGMVAGGLLAIVRGDVTEVRTLLLGAPLLLALGALTGRSVGHRTSARLLTTLPRRTGTFALAGAISMPLALCVGQLKAADTTFGMVVLLPGCVTGGLYLLAARRARHQAAVERAQRAQQNRHVHARMARAAHTDTHHRNTTSVRR